MALQTLGLITSDHPGWTILHAALRARRDICLREIAPDAAFAARSTDRIAPPDVILVAADRADALPLPRLVRHLGTSSPTSKIIVIGPEATLDGDTLVALLNLGVPGYLTWEGLDPVAVLRGIAAVLAGEVVGSPAVLAAWRADLERRRRPRVSGLVLTTEERVASGHRQGGNDWRPKAKATLWANNPDVAFSIPLLLAHVGVSVDPVETATALLAAIPHTDFLIIDCATDADASARCHAIVPHATIPLLICHPTKGFVDDFRLRAPMPTLIHWLPVPWTGQPLCEKIRALQNAGTTVTPILTLREREVGELIAAGQSNSEIAAQLRINKETVKSHVRHLMLKYGVTTRAQLVAACRILGARVNPG